MVHSTTENVTVREPLSGENLVYAVSLLISHVTIWGIVWKLGVIGYNVFLLLITPAILLTAIISVVYSAGVRKGWVKEPSKENEKKLILILISSIIVSVSSLMVFYIVIL
ncbi:hypothetical protein [Archaeoglobus neptunius]|uniref:hypothetical protein n=1 Tax=Archaeoglobus neptunius TaxID=2798580 RepID=UPI001925FBF5|nr:hypothetical protein [Archaeoglobus neptunius]